MNDSPLPPSRASTTLPLHLAVGWALVIGTLGLIAFYVPPADDQIGESYLIFFMHFPSALNSLVLFVLGGALSAVHLLRSGRPASLDLRAAAAIEVGVLACTITLVTGSIWAKAAWGLWWDPADPRLMSVAIMWLTYVGYLVLRGMVEEPSRRARFCAVFAVVATLNVPLVHYAIRLFRQVSHPAQVTMAQEEMKVTRWFGFVAFLVLYTALWRLRSRVSRDRHDARRLEEGFASSGI